MTHLLEPEPEAETHQLIGGELCLDFANTLNSSGKNGPREFLRDYRDLVVWCQKTGILSGKDSGFLIAEAIRRPDQASAALERARALRGVIYRVFLAFTQGSAPGADDLAHLNGIRSEALAGSRIVQNQHGFSIEWPDGESLERMLWPITLSAVDLLTSGKTGQVRQCAGVTCDWLFLDTSRNHQRRWCSMDDCGNRAKSRRFNERKRNL
jgi:predicted RNA-binding Zn ribbon-like protein